MVIMVQNSVHMHALVLQNFTESVDEIYTAHVNHII